MLGDLHRPTNCETALCNHDAAAHFDATKAPHVGKLQPPNPAMLGAEYHAAWLAMRAGLDAFAELQAPIKALEVAIAGVVAAKREEVERLFVAWCEANGFDAANMERH